MVVISVFLKNHDDLRLVCDWGEGVGSGCMFLLLFELHNSTCQCSSMHQLAASYLVE